MSAKTPEQAHAEWLVKDIASENLLERQRAHAPEMAELLEEVTADIECYCLDREEMIGKWPCVSCRARALLAKIKGETP